MHRRAAPSLTVVERRRARRQAYLNGGLWAVGNGLLSTTLVTYLASELGAEREGLGVSLILAARHFVGLLRMAAPAVIGRWADRKPFCIVSYLLSTMVLMSLPWLAAPGCLPTPDASLAALVVIWCLYHVLEYLGTVALWSWLGDLAASRVRGRFLGRRERWMLVGQIVATIVAAAFAQSWKQHVPQPLWIAYAITAGVGAVVMAASLLPLLQMPAAERRAAERPSPTGATPPRATPPRPAREGLPWRALVQPFRDGPFLRLLLFNCWFSACNGLTQTAQNLYPIRVLHISLALSLAVQTAMRGGQWAISPGLGRLADRRGNRPMMAVCLLIVALGPLCYCAATAERWQWYFGAWAAWVAYAGLNVGLPNLLLRLAPRQTDTPYIATYYAIGSACYAAATVAGGQALDWLRGRVWDVPGLGACDVYQVSFLLGWAARTAGAALLWLIVVEPPVARRPPPG